MSKDKIVSPDEKVGFFDFLIKHSKKIIITLVVISLVVSAALVGAWWYTGGGDVVASYGDKKVLKTEYDDAKIKCESFYQYNKDSQGKENCSETRIEDQIFRKALETEAENRGITVTTAEVNKRYTETAAAYGGEDQYRSSLKSTYNWTPEYVKENFKRDILQEKLESYLIGSRDVSGMFVRWDWYIGEPSFEQREPNRASAKKVIEDNFYPLMKKGTSKEDLTAAIKELKKKGDPWDKEYNTGFAPFQNINAKTAPKNFAGEEDWNAISKLQKVGEITNVVDSSGGYFVVYKLDNISGGSFADWDDFKKDAVSKAKIRSVSYHYKNIKKVASKEICNYSNSVKQALNIKTANATSCGWYSFSGFWGFVYDGSDHSLPLNGVSVVASENTTANRCDQEASSYSQTTPNNASFPGAFALGSPKKPPGDGTPVGPPYMLSCYRGWYLTLTKPGYENIQYNLSTSPNGAWIAGDRVNYAGWEWYTGPEGIYRTWNTDGNGYIFMKPTTPAPTCSITAVPDTVGSSRVFTWTSTNATSGTQYVYRGGSASPSYTNTAAGASGSATIDMYQTTDVVKVTVSGAGGSASCQHSVQAAVTNTCPTCNATPGSVRQGEPVTISWSGGTGAVTSLIQNPGATIANPTSGIQVLPSTSTSYSLMVQGIATACACNPVPVVVRPNQSGSEGPVPPN